MTKKFDKKKIFMFGDTMYDLAINTSKELEIKTSNEYILMTLHREKNTAKKNNIDIKKILVEFHPHFEKDLKKENRKSN